MLISATKDFAKDTAVAEVKSVAREKTAELKAKVAENTEGKTAEGFGAGLSGLLKDITNAVDSGFDGALINNGFHPDAPNFCVTKKDDDDTLCRDYTETELLKEDYDWINTMWKTACPISHAGAMDLLKTNGQITYNDKRMLNKECQSSMAAEEMNERETLKQKLLEGLQ